jgi:hypothetical protein
MLRKYAEVQTFGTTATDQNYDTFTNKAREDNSLRMLATVQSTIFFILPASI